MNNPARIPHAPRNVVAVAVFATLAFGGCSTPQTPPQTAPTANTTTRPPRAHPSQTGMAHAFERVQADANRCLRPGDSLTVRGEFDGPTGDFRVTAVTAAPGTTLPYNVDTCVRTAAGRAHVRPFTDARASFEQSLSLAGTPANGAIGLMPVPSVSGTMVIAATPSPVDRIQRESDALQRCYEQACERDHTIAGSIELHLVLNSGGQVAALSNRVQTDNEDANLMDLVASCIESHVRLIQFGTQSNAGYEWIVPLTFHPGGVPID